MIGENRWAFIIVFSLIFFNPGIALPAGGSNLEIVPPYLHLSVFYSGQDMEIKGIIPSDRDVILEVRGPEGDEIFHLKGRVGPFWINREKIKLKHVPSLYMLILPGDKKWDRYLSSSGVGIEKIKEEVTIIAEREDLKDIFGKFIQLKQADKLYSKKYNAIVYSDGPGNTKNFKAKFHLPASITPGKFRIEASIVHDGRKERTIVRDFGVEEVGFIKAVHELAYHKGLLYGVLCVIIALFVGGIMGLFFKHAGAH